MQVEQLGLAYEPRKMAQQDPARRLRLPPEMEPRYLSREEAAAYLGASLNTFDDEVASSMWPAAGQQGRPPDLGPEGFSTPSRTRPPASPRHRHKP